MAQPRKTGSDSPTTTLDTDVTKPSVTQPGDGPADTLDPNERATSITPMPGIEALRAGTVNAVVPLPVTTPPAPAVDPRFETYPGVRPDGSTVTITRNLETGEVTTGGSASAS